MSRIRSVLLTRPSADSREAAEALAARGVDAVIAPLIEIETRRETPLLSGVRALLITSANGLRAFAQQSAVRNLPVFAVGDASATAARDLGFATVESAAGNVEDLAALVVRRIKPGPGQLLHPAGTALAGDLSAMLSRAGYDVRRYVAYAARPMRDLPAEARQALTSGTVDAVLLYSPRTAEIFRTLVTQAQLSQDCRFIEALCLSDAVAGALAPLKFRDIRVAARPDQEALFSLLDQKSSQSP